MYIVLLCYIIVFDKDLHFFLKMENINHISTNLTCYIVCFISVSFCQASRLENKRRQVWFGSHRLSGTCHLSGGSVLF